MTDEEKNKVVLRSRNIVSTVSEYLHFGTWDITRAVQCVLDDYCDSLGVKHIQRYDIGESGITLDRRRRARNVSYVCSWDVSSFINSDARKSKYGTWERHLVYTTYENNVFSKKYVDDEVSLCCDMYGHKDLNSIIWIRPGVLDEVSISRCDIEEETICFIMSILSVLIEGKQLRTEDIAGKVREHFNRGDVYISLDVKEDEYAKACDKYCDTVDLVSAGVLKTGVMNGSGKVQVSLSTTHGGCNIGRQKGSVRFKLNSELIETYIWLIENSLFMRKFEHVLS